MSRVLLSALLLTSCAAEVPPRAEPGDPRVMPVGATAALDGSFSEGDGLRYAWAVAPEGATLLDAASPFATLIAEAPGLYTLSLEVCDESGRCDVAETWARVDAPGDTSRISDWSPDLFGGAESGAGLDAGLDVKDSKKCAECRKAKNGTQSQWEAFCRTIHSKKPGTEAALCWAQGPESSQSRDGYCSSNWC
jgi:hypothetical protein